MYTNIRLYGSSKVPQEGTDEIFSLKKGVTEYNFTDIFFIVTRPSE